MSLPVLLNSGIGRVLVVGGGTIAARKVDAFARGEFNVTVLAPDIAPSLLALERVRHMEGYWKPGAEAGFALVLACTNDRAVNRHIGEACRAAGIPVLVADAAEESTFTMMALHRDGPLTIAVATDGTVPGLARQVRDRIASLLGDGWANLVSAAGSARQRARHGSADEDGA